MPNNLISKIYNVNVDKDCILWYIVYILIARKDDYQ